MIKAKAKSKAPGRPSNALVGIAGVHHVASELSRRGMIALPTVRNTAAYDIAVLNREGTPHANIQVKASSKRVSFFPMPPVAKVRDGPDDYYVLVRWLDDNGHYECFLLTGKEARRATRSGSAHQGAVRKADSKKMVFPAIYVAKWNAREADRWQKAWQAWEL
jgi:hypothetical protein